MPDLEKMTEVADAFLAEGMGLVAMAGFIEDGDLKFKCFSTVSKEDVYSVLERAAETLSLLPFDLASLMNGDFIAKPPDERMTRLVQWGADHIDREEPLIMACVSEGQYSAFVVGDAPMLVYMSVRMMTTLKQSGKINLYPFAPSDN